MSSHELLRAINAHLAVLDSHQRDRKGPTLLAAARDLLQKQQDGVSRIIDLVDGHTIQRNDQPGHSALFHYNNGIVDGLQLALDTFTDPS